MLAHRRFPVCLSFFSTDLPIIQTLETSAIMYQKDEDKFHLLLNQSDDHEISIDTNNQTIIHKHRLIWLEIAPARIVMTMQGNGLFNYRHFWEQGVYGTSRYWLKNDLSAEQKTPSINHQNYLRLRNYTHKIQVEGKPLPQHIRVEYELWSDQLSLGHYILHLDLL